MPNPPTETEPVKEEQKPAPIPPPQDVISQTRHAITLGDRTLHYTATTGRIILKAEDEKEGEKPKAAIFFVAYTLDPPEGESAAEHAAARPLTFAFNGGPGSSSVWLHMGLLGPRRTRVCPGQLPLGGCAGADAGDRNGPDRLNGPIAQAYWHRAIQQYRPRPASIRLAQAGGQFIGRCTVGQGLKSRHVLRSLITCA